MPRGDNNRKLSDDDRSEVIRRYTTPLPDGTWEGAGSIGQSFGVSDGTILYTLSRAGIAIRSAKEAHAHGKRCGPIKHTEQFDSPPLCACGCGSPVPWRKNVQKWMKFLPGHRYQESLYKKEQWLRTQYETLRRNIPDIATECGVQVSTVARRMERLGIVRRTTKESLIGVQSGANNPAWKGGTTPERQRQYKTQEWKVLLKAVYVRDRYTCQRCKRNTTGGKSMRSSVAHHIKSYSDYPELRTDMGNLITLCRECHLWVHSLANTDREFLD